MDNKIAPLATGGVPVYNPLSMPAEGWDVLWENANPNAAFAPQTLSIPTLKDYNLFAVTGLYGSSTGNRAQDVPVTCIYIPDSRADEPHNLALFTVSTVTSGFRSPTRAVSIDVSSSTVTFGTGQDKKEGSHTDDNARAIPLYILGTKI